MGAIHGVLQTATPNSDGTLEFGKIYTSEDSALIADFIRNIKSSGAHLYLGAQNGSIQVATIAADGSLTFGQVYHKDSAPVGDVFVAHEGKLYISPINKGIQVATINEDGSLTFGASYTMDNSGFTDFSAIALGAHGSVLYIGRYNGGLQLATINADGSLTFGETYTSGNSALAGKNAKSIAVGKGEVYIGLRDGNGNYAGFQIAEINPDGSLTFGRTYTSGNSALTTDHVGNLEAIEVARGDGRGIIFENSGGIQTGWFYSSDNTLNLVKRYERSTTYMSGLIALAKGGDNDFYLAGYGAVGLISLVQPQDDGTLSFGRIMPLPSDGYRRQKAIYAMEHRDTQLFIGLAFEGLQLAQRDADGALTFDGEPYTVENGLPTNFVDRLYILGDGRDRLLISCRATSEREAGFIVAQIESDGTLKVDETGKIVPDPESAELVETLKDENIQSLREYDNWLFIGTENGFYVANVEIVVGLNDYEEVPLPSNHVKSVVQLGRWRGILTDKGLAIGLPEPSGRIKIRRPAPVGDSTAGRAA